jgi:hypothetical protein
MIPSDEPFDDRVPMPHPDESELKSMISEHLGGQFESELAGHKVKRMADDSFRVDDRALGELPGELLGEIERALSARKR